MSVSSAALLSVVGAGVFVGNGLWSLLPTWQAGVSSHDSVRVEGPVSDSAIASVECNCHCPSQDIYSLLAGSFVAGIVLCGGLQLVFRCWRAKPAASEVRAPHVTHFYSAPAEVQPRVTLAVEDAPEPKPRKVAVTPSTRRR